MKNSIFIYFGFIILFIISAISVTIYNESKIGFVKSCKILELQQQQKISGSGKNISTEIRYLVVSDKETFICESSLLNGKFDNSNIFFHLKKDSIYNFKVCGSGKSFIFDYRNILEVSSN